MAKVEILNANGAVVSSADVMTNVNITGTGDSAKLKVYNGGYVSGGTIAGTSAGESFYVYAGGVMSGVTISYTSLYGTPTGIGGVLSGCTVEGKSFIVFGNGGKALDTVVNTDIRCDLLYAGAYASGTIIRKGSMRVYGGTRADDTTVSGGLLDVYSNSTVSGVTVVGGTLRVSGGVASAVTATGGSVTVSSGARLVGGSLTGNTVYTLAAGGVMENVSLAKQAENNPLSGTLSGCTFVSGGVSGAARVQLNAGSAVNCTVAAGGRFDFSNASVYVSGTQVSGSLYLQTNGTALDTTIYGGSINVMTNAMLNGVTISGGTVAVRLGNAKNATILGGRMYVDSGRFASGVEMTGGTLDVSGGAAIYDLTATGGTVNVSGGATVSGGSLTGNTVYHLYSSSVVLEGVSLAKQAVTNPQYATLSGCTFVGGGVSGGVRVQLNGGSAVNCTVAAGGRFDVTAASVAVSGLQVSGDFYLNQATASNTTVYDGGSVNILNHGVLDGATMSGGWVGARSGDVKNITILNGTLDVAESAGFSASKVTMSGGTVNVSRGGTVADVTMTGGTMTLASAAVASGVTMSGGTMNASSGATVSGVEMTAGTMKVSGGAVASGVTMTGGAVTVNATGKIYDLNMTGGNLTGWGLVSGGSITGTATFTVNTGAVFSGVTIGQNNGGSPAETGNQGGILSGCTITDDTFITFGNGGKVLNNVISGNYRVDLQNAGAYGSGNVIRKGGMRISAGTTAHDTTVSGGTLDVYIGGTVSGVNVVGGTLYLNNDAGASAVTMTDGRATATSGALLKDVTMTGGTLTASAGGTVSGVTMTAGSVVVSGGVVSGLTASDGTVTVKYADTSKGKVYDLAMTNGTLTVENGGVVSGGSLTGAATFAVKTGGVISAVTIGQNGGGKPVTTGNQGGILSGCTITDDTFITFGGTGKSLNNVISGNYRIDLQNAGAYGSGNVICKGGMKVSSGTTAHDTTVSGGCLELYVGGAVSGVTMTGGTVSMYTGAAASCFDITGGMMSVSSATASDVTMTGGTLNVSGGATVSGVTMNDGTLNVSNGGAVSGVTMNDGTATVANGAALTDVIFSGGTATISNGATLTNLTCDGGWMAVYGGTFKDWTLDGGVGASVYGSITLDGTINIAGQVYFNAGGITATVTATDATVIFDMVNYKSGINGMFYYLEKLQGAGELRIAVSSASEVGSTYEMTRKATLADFNRSFNVYKDGKEIGYVTLNNTTVTGLVDGGKVYTLNPYDATEGRYKVQFQVLSSLVKDLAVTADDSSTTVAWDAVNGVSYQVSVDGGSTWEAAAGSSYTYDGTAKKDVQVRMADTQGNYGTVSEITVAGTAEGTAVASLVDNASAGATIVLRDGSYTSGGVITMKAGQTLEGQGTQDTTVAKAIYGAGNAVTIKNLKASTNVAGGAVNAAAAATDLTVASALLTDAFAGSLVKSGTVEVTSAGADLTGTTFRNLYGAGYATGSTTMLTNSSVELNVSGGCTTVGGSGCIYGAGRVASGATLNVSGTVAVNVANGTASSGTLGGLYAGGYANGASVLNVASTNVAVKSGVFSKFVAAGVQVYGSGTTGTVTEANLTISGGEFNNAVLGASYAAGGASASVTTATTTISGGTFQTFVAGGGYANGGTLTVGSVDLTISGGKFVRYVFGGNLGTAADGTDASVTGQVHLTLDASTATKIEASAIYAGSLNGSVGSTLVELKGNGSNLEFGHLYGSNANPTEAVGVNETKTLYFNGFSGDLKGQLFQFDAFTMVGSTVAFAKAQDLTAVSTWNLDLTGTGVSADTALIDWSTKLAQSGTNDFDGDTMNLTFDTASTTDLLLITGDASLDLATDDMAKVTFNEVSAAKQDNGSWMANVGGVDWYLKNSTTDGVNNLVLTTIA